MTLADQSSTTLAVASYISLAIGAVSVIFAVTAGAGIWYLSRRNFRAARMRSSQVGLTEADYLAKLADVLDQARARQVSDTAGPEGSVVRARYERSLDEVEQGLNALAVYHRSLPRDLRLRVARQEGGIVGAEDSAEANW
jgi:hypothetical protein